MTPLLNTAILLGLAFVALLAVGLLLSGCTGRRRRRPPTYARASAARG